ncbi:MAG: DNA mismatch repair endonuclease MutL [Ruminococcus sp.]|nr:DNA mismatch repair endonuclease MutL [Ruminococcus sp.]
MAHIQVLDQITIDKIAAGEVIERPASVVKELVENAIDAGASSISVEIEDGGISLIRIKDDGGGILKEDIRNAFLRHSTSKIQCVEDLSHIASLGFRGEALSSIAAVAKVELITKPREETFGIRYTIEGGKEISFEDTGAADGTIFAVRQLFYNMPARRKFLKTPMTEAGHVQDLLMRLALSHPEVGIRFLNNGQEKLRSSGSGKLEEVIYQIYGRDVAANLLKLDFEQSQIRICGYIGKPMIARGNRNFETFFVNGRYVKSAMISKALEDAYKDFSMQHKFPFAVLSFSVDGEQVDVNVHPTKMELRFQKQQDVYNAVFEGIHRTLLEPEMIPQVPVPEPARQKTGQAVAEKTSESPFLLKPKQLPLEEEKQDEDYFIQKMRERVMAEHGFPKQAGSQAEPAERVAGPAANPLKEAPGKEQNKEESAGLPFPEVIRENKNYHTGAQAVGQAYAVQEAIQAEQLDLFEEKFLKRDIRAEYKLIGQVFETYWLVQFQENLYIIDQHAAHERVLYERTLKEMKNRDYTSQYLSPPIILTLSMQESQLLEEYMDRFLRIGFEIEHFGGKEYAVRAVPANLFGIAKKELLLEMLDSLSDGANTSMTPDLIDERVASLSCKAAVKGNSRLSAREVDTLIGELLLLENPYHCPHGRPTIISMTKRELEKKFKRIV